MSIQASSPPQAVARRQWSSRLTSRATSDRGLFVAGAVLAAIVLCCVLASLLAPYDPNAVDLAHVYAGPSGAHLLGTDAIGRDLLSRLMYGGRTTLLVPLLVTVGSGSSARHLQ